MADGPLDGVRLVEIAGIGPGPFAGFMLADMGADVIRVDRADRARTKPSRWTSADALQRGRRSIAIDLKSPQGREVVLDLVGQADGMFEGFRPGVMERLGLGPDKCLDRNARLVYGRMTGWGQDGPYAVSAGHDINFVALAGALWHFGRKGQPPTPAANVVGDFGGGGMLLAYGMVCGLLSAARTGVGQVVDAAMVDGAAAQMMMAHSLRAMGAWREERGGNPLDTGAHFYEVYETKDGEYVSVGAVEPQFYAELLERLGLEAEELPAQLDRTHWDELKARFAAVFKVRTRAEWCELLEGTDACFAPVLRMSEAPRHPHNRHRETFVEVQGIVQPAPAPRFSATPGAVQRPPSFPGQHTDQILTEWLGTSVADLKALRDRGAVG